MSVWTRRGVALLGLGVVVGALARGSGAAETGQRRSGPKSLHTGEVVKATFDRAAGPDPATLAKLQHVLRDYRANEEHPMDPALYGLLSDLALATGHEARYEIISGYRSPQTNAQLHAAGHAVAEHSQHMEGRAIDVRLLGCDLATFRDAALKAGRGGVGFYPSSNFVHVDTGRVRSWEGR